MRRTLSTRGYQRTNSQLVAWMVAVVATAHPSFQPTLHTHSSPSHVTNHAQTHTPQTTGITPIATTKANKFSGNPTRTKSVNLYPPGPYTMRCAW